MDFVSTDYSEFSFEERIALLLALEQINGLADTEKVTYRLEDVFSKNELLLMKKILLENPPSKNKVLSSNSVDKLSNQIFRLLLLLSKNS